MYAYTSPTFAIYRWPSIRLTAAVLWRVGHVWGWPHLDLDGSAFNEIIQYQLTARNLNRVFEHITVANTFVVSGNGWPPVLGSRV